MILEFNNVVCVIRANKENEIVFRIEKVINCSAENITISILNVRWKWLLDIVACCKYWTRLVYKPCFYLKQKLKHSVSKGKNEQNLSEAYERIFTNLNYDLAEL